MFKNMVQGSLGLEVASHENPNWKCTIVDVFLMYQIFQFCTEETYLSLYC